MKKKLLAMLLAAGMVMSLCACGSDKEKTETGDSAGAAESTAIGNISTKDYKVEDYVTVGDYSGMEVTIDVVNWSEKDLELQFNEELEYYIESADLFKYTKLDKTTVEEGDIVNIDYVGKKDGVAFDGGTAQGYHLEIGSGSFIPGFEDGLIGCEVGKTTTLNLTFPENYHSEELAGQAVTFDVTIHSIDSKEMPEINDALVKSLDIGYDTVDAFKEDLRMYLQETCDDTNASEKETAVWEAVYGVCTVSEPPQEMVEDAAALSMKNMETYASYYGAASLEEFITTYVGYTMEEFEAETKASAVEMCKEKLAVAAIAKKAGIEVTEEEVKAAAEESFAEYGYASADDMLADLGKGDYYDVVLCEKVYEYLPTCVIIKENEPVSVLADMYEEEDVDDSEGEVVVIGDDEEVTEDEESFEEEEFEEDPTEELILQTE